MSAGAANWVWANSRATNGSLLVLLAIAFEIDDKGNCVMSIAELAARSRVSNRTVPNAVADLVRLGEVRVRPKAGGHGRNGYELCLPGDVRSYADSAHLDSRGMQNLHTEVGNICTPSEPGYAESAQVQTGHTEEPQVDSYADSAPVDNSSDMFVSSTGTTSAEVKDVPAKPPRRREDRPEVDLLCDHLASRIEGNGCKRPAITEKWRDAARLMLDKDGYTEQQVKAAIDWSQDHEFWRANILSMPKLREKYEQLRMQAVRDRNGKSRPGQQKDPDEQLAAALQRISRRKESANGTGTDGHDRPLRQIALPPAENR